MLRAARSYRLLCQETDPLAVKAAVDDHAGGDPVLPIPLESRYKWLPRPGDPQDAVYMSTRHRSHPRSSLYDDMPSAEARNGAILFHLLQLYCETSPSHTYGDHAALFADHVERGLIEQLGEDGRISDRTRFTLAGLLACFPRLRYVSRAHRTAFLLCYRALHSSLPRLRLLASLYTDAIFVDDPQEIIRSRPATKISKQDHGPQMVWRLFMVVSAGGITDCSW